MSVGVTSVKPPALSRAPQLLNKTIVTAYRGVGFVVLTCVLFGLASYIGVHLFYFVHQSWLAPAIISPADPAVLDLSARVAHETWMRQQVAASRAELEARVQRDKSVEALELAYQSRFRDALAQDAAARNWSFAKLANVNREYSAVREKVESSAKDYGELAGGRSAEQLSAKLIDQDVVAMRNQKLTEILQSGVAFRERQTEISARMLNLNRESAMLAELSKAPSLKAQGLTLDGLAIAKRYEESVLAGEGAVSDRVAAERSMAALDTALKHYDQLLKTLETSNLLRAATRNLNLAFVPYANEEAAQAGAPLYGCRFQLLVCRRVGRVKAVLEGEVVAKHPVYGSELRGNYVELEIEEAAAMRLPVLHLGRRPLLF